MAEVDKRIYIAPPDRFEEVTASSSPWVLAYVDRPRKREGAENSGSQGIYERLGSYYVYSPEFRKFKVSGTPQFVGGEAPQEARVLSRSIPWPSLKGEDSL